MLFNSLTFLFWFFPITFFINLVIKKKYSNYFLAFASLFFYFWGESKYTYIFVLSVLINFIFGLLINKYDNSKLKKTIFIIGIIVNVLLLGYYKYFNYILGNINNLSQFTGFPDLPNPSIHLPIGISFFTFEAIAYLADLYNKKCNPIKNPVELLLYMGIFPHLIAGPVIRYLDLEDQLKNRNVTIEDINYGFKRFIIGLSKKVLIANQIGLLADTVFNNSNTYYGANIFWLGLIAYALQLYYDFSGYSDMAIGLGRMFGFTFIENFDYPYISKSVQEFWRRWNISLGIWFKNYIYIPLGGSKVSLIRNCFNLFLVFFLTGIWHGAGTNFVVWGLYLGIFVVMEKLFINSIFAKLPTIFGHIYLLFVILISWVFFRADNISVAFNYIQKLFRFSYQNPSSLLSNELLLSLIIGLIFAFPFVSKLLSKLTKSDSIQLFSNFAYIVIFVINIAFITSSTYNPFIYFRF